MYAFFYILLFTISSLAFSQPNWTVLPNAPTTNSRFEDIMFISPDVGWLVHSQRRVYKTTDGGESWDLIYESDDGFFRSVVFADSLHGWIGSLAGPDFLFQTVDGGNNWSSVHARQELPVTGICGFSAANDSVIYGVGRFDGDPWLIKTTNKGQTWEPIDMSFYASSLVDCFFFDADTGFVVGGAKTSGPSGLRRAAILQTYDGGQTWFQRKATQRDDEWCWKISFVNRDTGFVSIETHGFRNKQQHILKTIDGGLNWEEISVGSNFRIQGIGFATGNLGWVGGRERTYETVDGGASWRLTDFEWENINRFRFFADTVGYAIGKKVYKYFKPRNPTSVTAKIERPKDFHLFGNYPNPFNPTTTITFQLTTREIVSIKIYNTVGQLVILLLNNSVKDAGQHEIRFDASELPSGVYICKIETEQFNATQKMLLIK